MVSETVTVKSQKLHSDDETNFHLRSHTSESTFKQSKKSSQFIAKLEDKTKFQKYLLEDFDTSNHALFGFENSVKAGIING